MKGENGRQGTVHIEKEHRGIGFCKFLFIFL